MTSTSRWYWNKSGKPAGPITWGELQGMAQAGRLRANDMVLREGRETWQPASTARDVEDAPSPKAPATMTPAAALAAMSASAPTSMPPALNADHDFDEDAIGAASGTAVNAGRLLGGLLLCGGGIVGTIFGYNAAVERGGGRYVIFTGPIIWGLVLIGRSFGRQNGTSGEC